MKLMIPGKGNSTTAPSTTKMAFIEHLSYCGDLNPLYTLIHFPELLLPLFYFSICVNQGTGSHLPFCNLSKLVGDGTGIRVKLQNQSVNMWSALMGQV